MGTKSAIDMEFKILQWNARSLCGRESVHKKSELNKFLDTFKKLPEVVCIQETWVTKEKFQLKLKGYNQIASFHRNSGDQGGGVATFVREGLDSEKINYSQKNENLEVAMIRVFGNKHNLDIINIYTNGTCKIDEHEYQELIKNVGKNHIILGDLNIRDPLWDNLSKKSNSKSRELLNFIEANNLIVLNSGDGTRIDEATGKMTALDLTLASSEACQNFNWYVHEDTLSSDHFPIMTSINLGHKRVPNTSIPRWNLNKADWTLFTELSKKMKINFDHNTINENNEQFIQELTKICDQTIPKTKPNSDQTHRRLPWWNADCENAIKEKKKAFKKFKKYKTEPLKELYRTARAHSKLVLDTAKTNKWQEFISTLNYKTDSKTIWNIIGRFNGKPFKPVEVLKSNNTRHCENIDKANILVKHYRDTSGNEMLSDPFKEVKRARDPIIEGQIATCIAGGENEIYNENFTITEFKNALNKKKSTSPGADTIHYDMLKHLSENCKWLVLKLINKSWTEGKLPDQWKVGTIIPLLKPNKPKNEPKSYRPIALTSALCKVMETMIANRLVTELEKNGHLAPTQSGFRKNRSTLDQLTRLESAIKKAKMENRKLVAVFLDLEKAFDLMWTNGVLDQLSKFKIKGRLLAWIQDFLRDRKIQVRVGDKTSDLHQIDNGSPQGSVLSPILFNVLINTLYDRLEGHSVDLTQFADDSAIWKTAKSVPTAVKILQKSLNEIMNWADTWGFKLSGQKTVCVAFNCTKLPSEECKKLTIGDQIITFSTCAKFLGMIFDYKLNWVKHIDDLVSRCNKDLNLMRYLSGTSYGADKLTLIKLYTTLIRSKIDYGCQAYNSASKNQLKRVERIQNAALRIATGAYKGTPTLSLNVECNITPIDLRRQEMQLKYWARSCPLGDKLPINKLTQNLALYETCRERLKGKVPYALNVQDLLTEYQLSNLNIQEPTLPEKYALESITPKSELATSVSKKTDSKKIIREKTVTYINRNYKGHTQIYTDGSKDTSKNITSCAFTIPEINLTRKFKLNGNLTVFTAELIAIEQALTWLAENPFKKVVILTDSLSAIQALQSGKGHARPDKLQAIQKLINTIIRKNINLSIDWCPAHCSIVGNELADAAAKSGANVGKQLEIKTSKTEAYNIIKRKIRQRWAQKWRNYHGDRWALSSDLQPKITQYSDERRLDRAYSRLRLGVNGLRGHNLFHSEADPLCPHCGDIEDTKHYLLECPHHDQHRDLMIKNIQEKITIDLQNINIKFLLNPSTAQATTVRNAVFQYLKDTQYTTLI